MTEVDRSKNSGIFDNSKEVKNVIVMIGDGMGPSFTSAYRYMNDDGTTAKMKPTVFDKHYVGDAVTHSDDPEENVTDSAAAATSMAAGIKTYNGAISVDNDQKPVKTILEAAKEKGMATGLVATSQINHATPAAFGAHNESRNNYNEIADQFYDDRINGKHKVDIILGGGTDYFDRSDRNLIKDFQDDSYNYVTSKQEMQANDNNQLLGLFAQVGLPKDIDHEESIPALEDMTNEALEQLDKEMNGFFLMVEGSQIDWAAHAKDSVSTMSEMESFAKAFETVLEFAKQDKHTQIILTADHSTGGFSIGRDGEYNFNPDVIKAAERTPEFMAKRIVDGASVSDVIGTYVQFEFTEEELTSIRTASETNDLDTVHSAISKVFNKRAGAGFTTGGHTGVDVPVYAYGPQSDVFSGLIDNTDIANEVSKFIKQT